jgi:hypothetical protein
MLVPGEAATTSVAVQSQDDAAKKEGFLQKTTAWLKENPGKSLLIAGGIITGGFLLMRGGSGTNGLEGLPKKSKRKKRKSYSRNSRKNKVKPQNLL